MNIKIGFGVDVHQLVEGRDLVVGGVNVPSEIGALGHSDADVLLHAICDAMLGALNLRDIGFHFSDQDPKYKNIDSQILLRDTFKLIKEKGFHLGNLDATVILEKPKLNPHIPQMQETIARILETEIDNVSIKATTHEKVDSFGTQKALKAYVVCLLTR
ncbi:2-C-methyl-D-erythritol 2,4-cyclodiphosphate synthase [Brumimicrobium aurantiacum]|uniref:2-C-methyl-D-erythritol 2,4-cyclodiphosphate synthase n=1 Tax=Brumimicrobium aurantiacum TaxID=1737063 RepID=A0A3E1EWY0_9FLAO|nr:2-C-methyl-D-erythritol 2,4-cyclodiphosphate synthase [Brumimicrobium aurantiacum]RFC53993.1 2-C-methyl-D-erythritol 2,4-cyclodiphosphate synthase [Brumimicrobium aurantiacum]